MNKLYHIIMAIFAIAVTTAGCLTSCKTPEEEVATPSLTIVLDLSTSTLGKVNNTSLQEMEFEVANAILDSLGDNAAYGFTVFAGQWSNVDEPSLNHTQARNTLQQIEALENCVEKDYISDGSAIYSALLSASLPLKEKGCPRSILLLTDGDDNSSNISSGFLAQWMQGHDIRIDVVSFTCKKGQNINYPITIGDSTQYISIEANHDFRDLIKIARSTNGTYVSITDTDDVEDAIEQVIASIRQGEAPTEQPDSGYIDERMRGWLEERIHEDEVSLF